MNVSLQFTELPLQLAQLSSFTVDVVIESVTVQNVKYNKHYLSDSEGSVAPNE